MLYEGVKPNEVRSPTYDDSRAHDDDTGVTSTTGVQQVSQSCSQSPVVLPDDLHAVVRAWPSLSPEVRQQIAALIGSGPDNAFRNLGIASLGGSNPLLGVHKTTPGTVIPRDLGGF